MAVLIGSPSIGGSVGPPAIETGLEFNPFPVVKKRPVKETGVPESAVVSDPLLWIAVVLGVRSFGNRQSQQKW
jgi:hypothetical protein